MDKTKKEIVIIIEYRTEPGYLLDMDERILDKLRETGIAEVVDVRIEEPTHGQN